MSGPPTPAQIRILLYRCGLSQTEAAGIAGTSDRVVRKWVRGEYAPPPDRWQHLVDLDRRQERAARETVQMIRERAGDARVVTILMSRDQAEAEARGWPCPGAHLAVVARVVEHAPAGIEIVPVYAGEDAAADGAAVAREIGENRGTAGSID